MPLHFFYVFKMQVCCFYGAWDVADEMRKMAQQTKKAAIAFAVDSYVFFGLDSLGKGDEEEAQGRRSQSFKKRARSCLRAIRRAVTQQHKGMNLSHRVYLLEAQSLALEPRMEETEIRQAYDRAITMASRAGFRQDAAMGNLLAGIYFSAQNQDDPETSYWARHYISRSVQLFKDWGAHGVSSHWEQTYPDLISKDSADQLTRSSNHLGRQRYSVRRPSGECVSESFLTNSSDHGLHAPSDHGFRSSSDHGLTSSSDHGLSSSDHTPITAEVNTLTDDKLGAQGPTFHGVAAAHTGTYPRREQDLPNIAGLHKSGEGDVCLPPRNLVVVIASAAVACDRHSEIIH
eukprot:CAMPEP_0116863038 /NCGR_PEP_ID=MMETSP0418-20121206/23984_1 /TAXON_ID=1158023 /ORGANISM="Astrosyne radiata, Strain 13vi08-1A" /LENGTH=344 /DNA_ID=CAMNT_0004497983 /DNA_START=8 /DNA_END=1044 /DNA_ORIENTATION=+